METQVNYEVVGEIYYGIQFSGSPHDPEGIARGDRQDWACVDGKCSRNGPMAVVKAMVTGCLRIVYTVE